MVVPLSNEPVTEISYTIREFCIAERISESTYFLLRKRGLGPEEMRIGSLVRITHQARLDWQSARSNPTGTEAVAMQKTKKVLHERARIAVKKALKSPKHISNQRRQRRAKK
jgi:hypothetical protein